MKKVKVFRVYQDVNGEISPRGFFLIESDAYVCVGEAEQFFKHKNIDAQLWIDTTEETEDQADYLVNH